MRQVYTTLLKSFSLKMRKKGVCVGGGTLVDKGYGAIGYIFLSCF